MNPAKSLLEAVPGIKFGFGTANELIPRVLGSAWDERPRKRQVHSATVCHVTQARQECGDVDAVFCTRAGIPLTMVHADCIPLLFARRDGKAIAALHGGWRGLLSGIISTLWSQLNANGEHPSEWIATIGPAIGPCCYEVSAQLISSFEAKFPHIPKSIIGPTARRLDLAGIAEAELRCAGVGQIERISSCTYCARANDGSYGYRSYRRGDRGPQQHSGLLITS